MLRKSGTFDINSGHLYKKVDFPGKHGTNGNPRLLASVDVQICFPLCFFFLQCSELKRIVALYAILFTRELFFQRGRTHTRTHTSLQIYLNAVVSVVTCCPKGNVIIDRHLCIPRVQTNKLRGLSPRVKYSERATAACRRS
jgi:hypothetical protein